MMCFRYRRLIIPYSEDALDQRTRAGMERHLESCEGCRRELEAVRSVSVALRGMDEPAAEPAPDLWAKVSARIADEAQVPVLRPWLRVTQTASGLATVALVAVVAVGMFGRAPETTKRADTARVASVPSKPTPAEPGAKVRIPISKAEAPEPVARPAPPAQPSTELFANSGVKLERRPKATSPAKQPKLNKERRLEMASVDLPNDHYRFKSMPNMDAASENKAVDVAYDSAPGGTYYSRPESKALRAMESDKSAARPAAAGVPVPARMDCLTPLTERSNDMDVLATATTPATPASVVTSTEETAVDALNRTEGVHIAAMFRYP